MNNFDQLHDLNAQLIDDEKWLTVLENTYYDWGVDNLEELIDLIIEEDNQGIVHELIDEGEYILSLKSQSLDDYYEEDGLDDYY
jgi:hypothetical protein